MDDETRIESARGLVRNEAVGPQTSLGGPLDGPEHGDHIGRPVRGEDLVRVREAAGGAGL
jgi:hypothetical protein